MNMNSGNTSQVLKKDVILGFVLNMSYITVILDSRQLYLMVIGIMC